jgi:hypothetical protein
VTWTKSALTKKYVVRPPPAAEHPLLGQSGKEALERNEDHRIENEVQQEPVEAEERTGARFTFDRHSRSAEQRGRQAGDDADRAERFVAAERQAERAEYEGRNQHEVQ